MLSVTSRYVHVGLTLPAVVSPERVALSVHFVLVVKGSLVCVLCRQRQRALEYACHSDVASSVFLFLAPSLAINSAFRAL